MNWKDYLHCQKRTGDAILLLLILIVLTLVFNAHLSHRSSSEIVLSQNDSIINEFAEFRESLKVNEYSTTRDTKEQKSSSAKQNISFSHKDRSISKRVDNAHVWETDSSQMYNNTEISDYISNSSNYIRVEKLKAGETISLNESDTTQWKKIPGIGSSYASRIVKYKGLLGGYVHKEQLMEVYGIDNEMYLRIEPYIVEDNNYLKLKVNELEFRDLLRHPYLNYEQVQAILNLRDRKGNIAFIEELAMLEEFTTEDISRLEPYFQFL